VRQVARGLDAPPLARLALRAPQPRFELRELLGQAPAIVLAQGAELVVRRLAAPTSPFDEAADRVRNGGVRGYSIRSRPSSQ
jgi:hypothetical protein